MLSSYGDLAQVPTAMAGQFAQMLASDDAPDPQWVRRHADLADPQLPVFDERWRRGLDEVHEVGVGRLEVLHDGPELAALGVGERDVDGDGKTDAIRASGGRWVYSPGTAGPWQPLRIDSRSIDSVAFGDFDGDGTDDIFRTGCH